MFAAFKMGRVSHGGCQIVFLKQVKLPIILSTGGQQVLKILRISSSDNDGSLINLA